MACLPGAPCYGSGESVQGCYDQINSNCVEYTGPNLPDTGIQTHDCLTLAIEKIDEKLGEVGMVRLVPQDLQVKPTVLLVPQDCLMVLVVRLPLAVLLVQHMELLVNQVLLVQVV